MLNAKQLIQDAAQYPHLDVYLYAVMRLAQCDLQESALAFRDNALILEYGGGHFWLFELTPKGLQLPYRVWRGDAARALQTVIPNVSINHKGFTNIDTCTVTHSNHVLQSIPGSTSYSLTPCDMLLHVWQEVDKILTPLGDNTPSNTKPETPNYGDATGSGINVHSQGELYPLYHMHWRGQDWLCYANHAVPEKQFKQELLALPPHDRTAFVVQYGVEIRPTKPEEKGCKSSVWPLEIREDKQRGMVFTWANLWMPYSKEFHKFLEGRTADQRRACIQVVGDVIA